MCLLFFQLRSAMSTIPSLAFVVYPKKKNFINQEPAKVTLITPLTLTIELKKLTRSVTQSLCWGVAQVM